MVTREQLEQMKVGDLRKLGKQVGVKNTHSHKKVDLIEIILRLSYVNNVSVLVDQAAPSEDVVDLSGEVKAENTNEVAPEVQVAVPTPIRMDLEGKKVYIETAPVGTLMAYRHRSGMLRTAKMINRSLKNRKLKMETPRGKQFVISFDDVVWVKTGKKWPQKIYEELKGQGQKDGNTKEG